MSILSIVGSGGSLANVIYTLDSYRCWKPRSRTPCTVQGKYKSISGYSYNNLLYLDYGIVREILWSDADCVIRTDSIILEIPLTDTVMDEILSFTDPDTLRLVECTNTKFDTFFTLITPNRYKWIRRYLKHPPSCCEPINLSIVAIFSLRSLECKIVIKLCSPKPMNF